MKLLNFVVWLSAGAVIGWFASQMARLEQKRILKPVPGEEESSEKG
jgi:hypothetical protein